MRGVSSMLVCWLLALASAEDSDSPGPFNFFSKGIDSVGSFVGAAGNNTAAAAKTFGQPIGSAAEKFGAASAGAAKSVGEGFESAGKAGIGAAKSVGEGFGTAGKAGVAAAETVGQSVQKEIQTVKNPVDRAIFYGISSQCKNVQKVLGVTYEQVADSDPNFDDLELVFKTELFETRMNINNAAAALRHARTYDNDSHLVVFCHGFTDDPSKTSFTSVSQAYFDGDRRMSLIAVNASAYIRWFYLRAVTLVRFIGERFAEVLYALYKEGQNPDKIHMVGHSLGAHISGYAAKRFENLSGRKLGRITGLDPAGPCFSRLDPALRLNKTDATYVDIIHTDAGVYGITDPVGDMDYFPNRGYNQPDCLLQTCSHSRSWELYCESVVHPYAFPAVRCKDWAAFEAGDCDYNDIRYMGWASQPKEDDEEEGLYFLQTNITDPFGLGEAGIKYRNTNGIIENIADFATG